jgi:two-component system sensor histidine kinase PilS (NtrC family)
LLSLPLEGLIGQSVLDRLRENSPGVADALTEHMAEGRVTSRKEGILRRNERAVPIGITTTSVSGDLRAEGKATTAIFQDISDQKRIDALNLRAQRLEAVAELSASLAHEIKNPLASIQSAVEQMGQRPHATPDERTLSELIVRESGRLSRLLSEFLDFARVQVARRDRVDLRTIVQGAAALAGTHPDRGESVRLEITVPEAEAPMTGDEDLLHRAIFNLILNALQASPAESEVHVTLRIVPADAKPVGLPLPGAAYALEVKDSGSGIAPEIADRLFEPFATTKPGGSGLGLAIVHRAIEAHRGVILVDTDSAGTRFTVLLPQDTPIVGDLA